MAYPEPRNLDDIYGPGAEAADLLAEYNEDELTQCASCGHTWPVSEITNGICPDCHLVTDGILPPVEERGKIWEMEEPIYELKPGLKRCAHILYGIHQCQLAELHEGRHAWEPSWVARVAAIEAADQF